MESAEFRFPQTGTRAHRQNRVFVRSYMACEPCRRTKAKCEVPDEGGSCSKCRREQRECLFSAERSSKKRRKTEDLTRASDKQAGPEDAHHGSASGADGCSRVGDKKRSRTQNNPRGPGDIRQSSDGLDLHRNGSGADPASGASQPQVGDRASDANIGKDVMHTVVASSKDALGLLFRAAEQQDASDDALEHPERTSSLHANDSPASALTSGAVPAPFPASALSSPTQAVIDIWDTFRFIRQGWFSPREAVTYIDLFYRNLSSLSPILDSFYSHHENHKALVYGEPLLCCTLLMISSRHHVLPGPGGASRAQWIHQRLWKHCEHLIQRITFGQEKYSVAQSRTVGSIESLLLITEWHPRALHFPPENDGWDSALAPSVDDTYGSAKRSEDTHLIRWREEVFEPAKRSDRMSWMLLGLATTLAHELGVFDNPEEEELDSDGLRPSSVLLTSKLRIRRLLFVYVNQLASRLGCTSLLSQTASQSIAYTPDRSESLDNAEKDRQALITLWIEITKLLKTAREMFFPSKSFTRQLLKSGRYLNFLEHFQPLLAQWHTSFQKYHGDGLSQACRQMLLIDYQYVRMYINSVAIQALVERMSNREGPDTELDYDFLEVENSQDYKYVQEVTDASRQILQTTVTLAEEGILRYSPVRVFLRITSASVFLLKAISLGARNYDLQKSLGILDQCIQALRSSTLDDIHLSSRFGMLIDRHVKRFRRNFRVQSRLSTGLHAPEKSFQWNESSSDGALLSRPGDQSDMLVGQFNDIYGMPTQVDGSIPIDDWLAQPFDPSIAPFGMGTYQSASGFEMDSLDFLWNMTR